MALDSAQHVQRKDSIPADLDLTPQDYFVLSRVDAPVKVTDLVRACGLPATEAEAIVRKLLEGGALESCEPRRAGSTAPSRAALRTAAATRKRRALASAIAGVRAPVSDSPPLEQPVASARRQPPGAPDEGPAEGEADERMERIERKCVATSDDRIDPGVPISVERQRWILAMADGHEEMSQFEILGILPTHDVKAIRRAYHETSRVLHPDAYHGRDLGPFRSLLVSLFREAKASYAELRREDVRAPWVDRRIEHEARVRRAEEAEEAEAREAREAAAAARRTERTRVRAQRKRDTLRTKMQAEANSMLSAAEAAEKDGNLAKAANLYLLATRADPGNEELEAKWASVRRIAREKRGADAYAKAQQGLEMGQLAEALPWLLEAAEASPTAEHLAHAAFSVRQGDPNAARDLAMRALEALRMLESSGKKVRSSDGARLRVWIGHAFLAASQVSTATAQAEQAARLRPDDAEVRALLKACKAK